MSAASESGADVPLAPRGGFAADPKRDPSRKPSTVPVYPDGIPGELKHFRQWLRWRWQWRVDRWTKVPIHPSRDAKAAVNDPTSWGTFEDALTNIGKHNVDGVGFVFTAGGPYCGIDLDRCRDPRTGEIEDWATTLIDAFRSYTEISPSSSGLHVIARAGLPDGGHKRGNIEVYDRGRYFAMTGAILPGETGQVEARQPEVDEFIRTHFPGKPERGAKPRLALVPPLGVTDADVVSRASKATNGEKFRRLFDGKWKEDYPSQSEADAAFCAILAFWTGDREQIDRIFRSSGLCRTKWDEAHHAGGTTYGDETITRALEFCAASWAGRGGDSSSGAAAAPQFNRTDMGNAERLIHRHGRDLLFCNERGGWLRYDGIRWQWDDTLTVQGLAQETVRQMLADASRLGDSAERKLLAAHAINSEQAARIDAMIRSARPMAPVVMQRFDTGPMLLNVMNGTIDLRDGTLRPHDRGDLTTKLAPVTFDATATCPTWLTFLGRIFDHDTDLLGYVQRASGYTLTGSTDEQCIQFAYGLGQNGKSTFFETLIALMGDYAQKAAISMLLAKKTDGIPNDIARLKGARFVVASEIPSGRRLDESLVKDLTGGDTLSGRFLYHESFDFTPSHKLWVYGNHRPVIHGSDLGIWRRLHLVPFAVTIPESEKDPGLKRKLREELPGILNWAVAGGLKWQREGLKPPKIVMDATKKYREDSDLLGNFLADVCNVCIGKFAPAGDLYRAYEGWCDQNGEEPVAQKTFGEALGERGFAASKKAGVRGRTGLEIVRPRGWGERR